MILKTSFTDWYDYLFEPGPEIVYPRNPRAEQLSDKSLLDDFGFSDRFAKDILEEFGYCFAVWIGVYPYIYLCPTNPWEHKHIEFYWWKIFNTPQKEWESQFPEWLRQNRPDEYSQFKKLKTSKRFFYFSSHNASWIEKMADSYCDSYDGYKSYQGNYAVIKFLKKYSERLEWDPAAKTFRKYYPKMFRDIKAPLFSSYFVPNALIVNPRLSEFTIPDIANNDYTWSKNIYHMPDELKEGCRDIADRISEFLTAANEPQESIRTDKEKIVSYGFDVKTSFRNMK